MLKKLIKVCKPESRNHFTRSSCPWDKLRILPKNKIIASSAGPGNLM